MSKVTWKRTRKGIEFIEKKTFGEKLQDVTFMEVSLFLFALSVLCFIGGVAWSIAAHGNAPWPLSLIGILVLGLSVAGVLITLYGHYMVEADSKVNWHVGLFTNGGMAALMLIISVSGAIWG